MPSSAVVLPSRKCPALPLHQDIRLLPVRLRHHRPILGNRYRGNLSLLLHFLPVRTPERMQ
ncbi:unnamed protein product [Leuciscus chuanchicus]